MRARELERARERLARLEAEARRRQAAPLAAWLRAWADGEAGTTPEQDGEILARLEAELGRRRAGA